jgi:hypothetical protein
MSAPIAAEVLREFGAEVRRFKSLKQAVRWYDAYRARQYRVNRDLSDFGSSTSRARIEQSRATYAALLLCFRSRDSGIDDDELGTLLPATLDFVCGERSLVYLAERNGLTEHGFSLWVARGERVLKRRLQARRLLLVEPCECGCGVEQLQEAA